MNKPFLIAASFAIIINTFAYASEDAVKANADAIFNITVAGLSNPQVVTACDGRKKVIVEGFEEGKPLPREKAIVVAGILNRLMDYCDAELITMIPRNRIDIQVSVNGAPFITVDNTDLKLPMLKVHGGQEHTSREMSIWRAEETQLIAKGYQIFHSEITGTNGISCDMCHPDATNTHPETYPKFQTQMGKVALLRDMINWCIINPMEGEPLPDNDERLKAVEAYILSTRKGVPLSSGRH